MQSNFILTENFQNDNIKIFFKGNDVCIDVCVRDFKGCCTYKFYIYNYICQKHLNEEANLTRQQQYKLRQCNISINDFIEADLAYEKDDNPSTYTALSLLKLKSSHTPTHGMRFFNHTDLYFYDISYDDASFMVYDTPSDEDRTLKSIHSQFDLSSSTTSEDLPSESSTAQNLPTGTVITSSIVRDTNIEVSEIAKPLSYVVSTNTSHNIICQGSHKRFMTYQPSIIPLAHRLRVLAACFRPQSVIYAPPCSGKSVFQSELRDKGILLYDTDELERWSSFPSTVITNDHALISRANFSLSIVPSVEEFKRRLLTRSIPHPHLYDEYYIDLLNNVRKSNVIIYSNLYVSQILNVAFDNG